MTLKAMGQAGINEAQAPTHPYIESVEVTCSCGGMVHLANPDEWAWCWRYGCPYEYRLHFDPTEMRATVEWRSVPDKWVDP